MSENRKLSMEELGRLSAEEAIHAHKTHVILILDNVRSMHNVGSVFRTADAFLIEEIILCGITPLPPHREINKTALGATETVKWSHVTDTMEALLNVRNNGYTILSAEQTSKSVKLHEAKFSGDQKFAVVLGNEVDGVNQQVIDASDYSLEIPQAGAKHSLNISVAAGVVCWELFRQLRG
jgi:23S rRNA (guanosine2251-2'-O)-methyltransferase